MDPNAWGIQREYWDMSGVHHVAPDDVIDAVLAAMGAGSSSPPDPPVHVVRAGFTTSFDVPHSLVLEDGTELDGVTELPSDLPLGYHDVVDPDGRVERVIVSPRRCHAPARRMWGWAAQLYSVRSKRSWGIGDLIDLRTLTEWCRTTGAEMTMVNPLHSPAPYDLQSSPYSPGSRLWRNPLYIGVEEVPGASELGIDLDELAAAGRALNGARLIDRASVWKLKDRALRRVFALHRDDSKFRSFCSEQGAPLEDFATFCALARRHGDDWRTWPQELRRPDASGIEAARKDLGAEIDYHMWLQWILDDQLEEAARGCSVVNDVAIGAIPTGADAWMWQGYIADGVRVGAPPDDFNLSGQDWGVVAFDPHKLRAAAYEPFVAMIRSSLRHAGGIRYDHVMGLWRLFWIPPGSTAADGLYVRYPASDLLDIVALESQRAGAFVVGEDLGTVEPGVREEMAARDMLSYKLMWFEPGPPSTWPEVSFGAVTNHDLPTIAGLWTGADLDDQATARVEPNKAFSDAAVERISALSGAAPGAVAHDVARSLYRALAQAPSLVVAATLEDALGVLERPNLPGTTDDARPNWSLALPCPLDDIETHPGPAEIASILSDR